MDKFVEILQELADSTNLMSYSDIGCTNINAVSKYYEPGNIDVVITLNLFDEYNMMPPAEGTIVYLYKEYDNQVGAGDLIAFAEMQEDGKAIFSNMKNLVSGEIRVRISNSLYDVVDEYIEPDNANFFANIRLVDRWAISFSEYNGEIEYHNYLANDPKDIIPRKLLSKKELDDIGFCVDFNYIAPRYGFVTSAEQVFAKEHKLGPLYPGEDGKIRIPHDFFSSDSEKEYVKDESIPGSRFQWRAAGDYGGYESVFYGKGVQSIGFTKARAYPTQKIKLEIEEPRTVLIVPTIHIEAPVRMQNNIVDEDGNILCFDTGVSTTEIKSEMLTEYTYEYF